MKWPCCIYVRAATQLAGKAAAVQALVQGNAAKLATKIIQGNNTYAYVHLACCDLCLDDLSHVYRLGQGIETFSPLHLVTLISEILL